MFLLLFYLFIGVSGLPNFVFVLTDDQDLVLKSLNYMKKTTKLIANDGITFSNFYVNSPICCPSRSTILTGKYAHNVNVFNNSISGGCSSLEWQKNHELNSIASILKHKKNYKTFYAGKYLNQYGDKDVGGIKHIPKGYDWWLGLKGNSVYYNYTLSINGSGHFLENDYLTDRISQYALDFLNEKSVTENNFFMMLAPPACHSPFTPAPRHQHLFPDLETVRGLPFNVTPTDKHWIVGMPPTSLPQNVTILNDIYKNRIRTLQAVDDMIEAIVTKLQNTGVLDNTYILFGSDNGFHIGQFTQPWDKRQPYESDIHVPFLIRGPKIPKKTLSEYPIAAVDILPTILDLADVDMEINEFDGQSFKNQLFQAESDKNYNKNILIEYWGEGNVKTIDSECPWTFDENLSECSSEAWCKCQDSRNNTYSCLLVLSNFSHLKFCVFETGFIEVYDLNEDPYEIENLKLKKSDFRMYKRILKNLKYCKSFSCYEEIFWSKKEHSVY